MLGAFSTSTDQPINFRVFHRGCIGQRCGPERTLLRLKSSADGAWSRLQRSVATQQLAYGEALALKVLPEATVPPGQRRVRRRFRTATGARRASSRRRAGRRASFDDSAWQHVESLVPIEANIDLRQWSLDAGMYGWPGYRGMSPWLRTLDLKPVRSAMNMRGREAFRMFLRWWRNACTSVRGAVVGCCEHA